MKPFTDQMQVDNKFYINDIWSCSSGIDIESKNIIKGRYLTEEELMGNEKVAVIDYLFKNVRELKNSLYQKDMTVKCHIFLGVRRKNGSNKYILRIF